MNFFTVGFVLCSFNLNLGSILNYALKIVGGFFMLGGFKEIKFITEKLERTKPFVYLSLVLAVLGAGSAVMIQTDVLKDSAANVISTMIGTLSILSVVYSQLLIIRKLTPDHTLVNDPSLLDKLAKAWNKLAVFTLITDLTDIIYRFAPTGNFREYVGVVQVFARFLMIIYVVVMGSAFNKVRADFNAVHPV